MFLLM
jgi:hypothetical protein